MNRRTDTVFDLYGCTLHIALRIEEERSQQEINFMNTLYTPCWNMSSNFSGKF